MAPKAKPFARPAASPPVARQFGQSGIVKSTKTQYKPKVRVPSHCTAFAPATFNLQADDKAFAGGNLWTDKTTDVFFSIPIEITTPTGEERYGGYRISCKFESGAEGARVLSEIDDFVEKIVREGGGVPEGVKLFPLMRANGWANFKLTPDEHCSPATPDCRDWSELQQGERGTLKARFRGVWRSESLGGYGAMIKLEDFTPEEEPHGEQPDPEPAQDETIVDV